MRTWYNRHQDSLSVSDKIADKIASFAGSMRFVYIHVVWFSMWIVFRIEPFPFGLLTMIVSLEAIFLTTFVMISQNRQEERDKVQAQHQYETQEIELQGIRGINENQTVILEQQNKILEKLLKK